MRIVAWLLCVLPANGARAHPDDVYWDADFGAAAADSRVHVLYIDGDDLYASGNFTTIGGIDAGYIARWDGTTWHALDREPGTVECLGAHEILVHDGFVYASGAFRDDGPNGTVWYLVARWDGEQWHPMGGLSDCIYSPCVNGIVEYQGDIYVGGGFRKVSGEPANGIARWDGNRWHHVGAGLDHPYSDVAISDMDTDGQYVYVNGWFLFGEAQHNFARWDGADWAPVPSSIRGDCRDLVVAGSDICVGGWFTAVAGNNETVNNVGRWDGSNWYALDGGTNDMVLSVYPVGSDLYAAGNFTRAGGKPASRVAVWDGADWRPLGTGLDLRGWTFAVAARDNGEVFVGGDHDTAGGVSSPRIARWFNPVPYPARPFPPNGATEQLTDIGFSWGTSGAAGQPDSWDVYMGTAPNPPLVAAGLTSPAYTPDTLYTGTRYYWKVVGRSNSGDHATGSVWTFRTEDLVTSRLVVGSASARCAAGPDTVTIDVAIEDAGAAIDAAGVDVGYPPVLAFLFCEPGDLVSGWDYFECADMGTAVRVGGFDTAAIPPGSYGTFATLYFLADCCAADSTVSYEMSPENLTDDLAGLRAVPGEFTCEYFEPDGDTNGDGYITSGDAYCTFDSYLSFPEPLPNDCGSSGWEIRGDVDCSGDLTPGDALCIYNHWKNGSCVFCDGAATGILAPRSPPSVSIREVRYGETTVDVFVAVSQAPAIDAFGLEIGYTDGPIDYLGVTRTASTLDFEQFGATVTAPDRVRIGGFHTEALGATAPTDLLVVRFELLDAAAEAAVTIEGFVDDLAGAAPVEDQITGTDDTPQRHDHYTLHQNYPNPFNPDTEIRYDVPRYAGRVRAEITIYDVLGRRVKRLEDRERGAGSYAVRWSGRNDAGEPVSSGVYFCVLRAGNATLSRKLVLLR